MVVVFLFQPFVSVCIRLISLIFVLSGDCLFKLIRAKFRVCCIEIMTQFILIYIPRIGSFLFIFLSLAV